MSGPESPAKTNYQFQVVWKNRPRTDYLVIHSSGTKPDQVDRLGDPVGYRYLDEKHRLQGDTTCGYHFVIPRDGALVQARGEKHIGNHCPGVNAISIGICVMGRGTGNNPDGRHREIKQVRPGVVEPIYSEATADYTPEQWETLRNLIDALCRKYPEARVVGHNEVSGRASVHCPGWDVKKWFQESTTRIIKKETPCEQSLPVDETSKEPRDTSIG